MSGPKVVNVRALRLQQQRQAQAQFADLHQAIAEWRSQLQKASVWNKDTEQLAATKVKSVESIQSRQDWLALSSEASKQASYFRSQAEQARLAHEQRLKQARQRRRTIELLARSLQTREPATQQVDLAAIAAAARSATDSQLAVIEQQLERCLAELAVTPTKPSSSAELSSHVIEASQTGTTPLLTLSQWQARHAPADPVLVRLDDTLADLETWANAQLLQEVSKKADNARGETDDQRRRQRVDSILFEVAAARKWHRSLSAATAQLKRAEARLAPHLDKVPDVLRAALVQATQSNNPDLLAKAAAEANAYSDKQERLEEAYARREAVLSALAELGYDVHEDMTAAWAEQGHIVIANRERPQCGLELTAAAIVDEAPVEDANIAMRPVALGPAGAAVSAADGLAIEQSWCADFSRWQQVVATGGFEHQVKLATPIGSQPVPRVALPSTRSSQDRRRDIKPLRKLERQ